MTARNTTHCPASSIAPCPHLPSLLPVFLMKSCCTMMGATEQCVTVPSALPFYLVPVLLATGQELGPEQHGSQAWGLSAVGTQVRGLELLLGSQGTTSCLAFSELLSSELWLLRVVIQDGQILPGFLGRKSLSGCPARVWVLLGSCSPGQGRERRILPQPEPDQPNAYGSWVCRGSPMGTQILEQGGLGGGIPESLPLPLSLLCIGFSALPKCPLTSPQSVKIPKIAV